ncbi:MAG: tetratricopeptide repeat protein [Spirochaetaceae bacterium]|jgi:tetratricopeptide (TPR) repeat protein|nr:tetratricopeptide repeat protein [Spirochaetaceae bacterium]
MFKKKPGQWLDIQVYRKNPVLTGLTVMIAAMLVLSLAFLGIRNKNEWGRDRRELLRCWEEGTYGDVYVLSGQWLAKKPLDFFLLSLRGFSSYQLAAAQINASNTLRYIDDCIVSLRKALLTREGERDANLRYVLGKAYYHKGASYADLAVRYLEEARGNGFRAPDIAEYLGLAYAELGDYRNSVVSLSESLNSEDGSYVSDLRLLAIARSYIGLGEGNSARAYLVRCIENSRDATVVIQARLLLGKVLAEQGEAEEAEEQFRAILDESGENADAHFELGELYAALGDATRARAEWRRALRINPGHGEAREKLGIYMP